MERLGPGNLPRTVGQGTNKDGDGNSLGTKKTPASSLRLENVEDLSRVSLLLYFRGGAGGLFRDARISGGGGFQRMGSRQRYHLSEIPPRPPALPRFGIPGSQARLRTGREIIGESAMRISRR